MYIYIFFVYYYIVTVFDMSFHGRPRERHENSSDHQAALRANPDQPVEEEDGQMCVGVDITSDQGSKTELGCMRERVADWYFAGSPHVLGSIFSEVIIELWLKLWNLSQFCDNTSKD